MNSTTASADELHRAAGPWAECLASLANDTTVPVAIRTQLRILAGLLASSDRWGTEAENAQLAETACRLGAQRDEMYKAVRASQRETATLTDRLAKCEAECDAWRNLARREVPQRMTPEQFAFMQESASEDSNLLDEAERRAWLIEPRVGGGWEISDDVPTGGGDFDVVVLACTRESLRDSLRTALRAASDAKDGTP